MTIIEGLLLLANDKKTVKTKAGLIIDENGWCHYSLRPQKSFHFSEVEISPPAGGSIRYLSQQQNLFETKDIISIDKLSRQYPYTDSKKRMRLSFNIAISVVLFFAVLLSTWAGIHYGIPRISEQAADQIPAEVLIEAGQSAVESLDKRKFEPSGLSDSRQQVIKKIFSQMIPDKESEFEYHLHFYKSEKIGANAFAFPSGDIVVTDGLIELAETDDELKAVLLHEIAHVEKRHSAQAILRGSVAALLIAVTFGDISSMGTIIVAGGSILLHSNYNRKMEIEADDYSIKRMRALGIDTKALATILDKIYRANDKETEASAYLSTHPSMDERRKRILSL